jgi:16S rRNA (adenine1518-N6/adenine1519-N6)-dimethyltransferase
MHKKKSLGQHFLHSAAYLGAVADAACIQKGETVLEIGPGEGTLTAVLLARGANVVALEKDTRLISFLRDKFAGKTFEIIEGDALDFDPSDYNLLPTPYKLVGNIPYYITGALFKKFLTAKQQPGSLVFLVQKEVAERIARSKKESILSLSVKAYGTPKYIKTVPAGAFSPPPQVDSAILAVHDISRSNFKNAAHESRFFDAVKRGFSSKRKLLKSNLGADYADAFEQSGLDEKVRAEDVPLQNWLELSS